MIKYYYQSTIEELRGQFADFDGDTFPFLASIDNFTDVMRKETNNRNLNN